MSNDEYKERLRLAQDRVAIMTASELRIAFMLSGGAAHHPWVWALIEELELRGSMP